MKDTRKKMTAALLATLLFALSNAAMATNGYFTHGVGTESKGMAGSGVGSPENLGSVAAATNPALAVFSDARWQVGFAIFSPMRSYEARGGINGQLGAFTLSNGKFDSENEAFPIPYVAKNWKLSEDRALTFVFYGRGGMNTEWDGGQFALFDPDGAQGPAPVSPIPGLFGGGLSGATGDAHPVAGVDLMQAFLSVNYAWKLSESFAIGFGPVVAVQMFEATGLPAFAAYTQTYADFIAGGGNPQTPPWQVATNLTNNGHDMATGFGGAIGIWGGSESFSYGLAYQSGMSMSEFDDYADLFAEDGGFDIPSTIKAGISIRAGNSARLNVDVERIHYSDADSVHNPIMNLITGCFTAQFVPPPTSSGCLGGPSGAGFGWQDVTAYKVGYSFQTDDRNTWRLGLSYAEQPIPSSEVLFNILAPGVMEYHMTAGWTSERPNGNVMSVSLMYAPSRKISGTSTFDPIQSITLEMSQFEIEFAYRF